MRVILQLFITCCFGYISYGSYTCCPDAWIPYQGSCYLFHDEDKLDWNEAALNWNGLSTPQWIPASEETMIKEESEERNVTGFWFGGSDQDIEGVWKRAESDEVIAYSDWSSNVPHSSTDNDYDCLLIAGLYDYLWRDAPCRAQVGYPICEKSKPTKDPNITRDCLYMSGIHDFDWSDSPCYGARLGNPLCELRNGVFF